MHQVIYSVGCGVHFSKPNNIGKSLEEKVNSLCAGQVMLFESCSGKNVKSLEDFFFGAERALLKSYCSKVVMPSCRLLEWLCCFVWDHFLSVIDGKDVCLLI